MQVAVFALAALASDLVVLTLDVVVAEGAGVDVHRIAAGVPILHHIRGWGPKGGAVQAMLQRSSVRGGLPLPNRACRQSRSLLQC